MPQIKWLPEALQDIERLHHFIHHKNPVAARRMASVIMEGARLLNTSPAIGRPMADGTGRRELFIPFNAGAYVLRYMIERENTAVIIRVWHSKEERL
jgi:plasmid stabilization system protein ParE